MGTKPVEIIGVQDPASGLEAVIVIDSTVLGPAAGGVRTAAYVDIEAATRDAAQLARAMTIKCALAGLDAGGGKAVVRTSSLRDRPAAFRALGRAIEGLDGRFRTAGDLGTTAADLEAMAGECSVVHTAVGDLARSVARGHLACVRAALGDLAGVRVAVQGAGAIGAAVCEALAGAGATVVVADIDRARAEATGCEVIAPEMILGADVDVIAPCARGGVIDDETAGQVRARLVCGAANNVFATRAAERALIERGVLVVPDVIASAGAVIDGIGASVMGIADRGPLIDALGVTAAAVLAEKGSELPSERAEALAFARIRAKLPE